MRPPPNIKVNHPKATIMKSADYKDLFTTETQRTQRRKRKIKLIENQRGAGNTENIFIRIPQGGNRWKDKKKTALCRCV